VFVNTITGLCYCYNERRIDSKSGFVSGCNFWEDNYVFIGNMKSFHILLLTILWCMPKLNLADQLDNIAKLIKDENTKELVNLFTATIELTIIDQEQVCSKEQASRLLDSFFQKNKPQNIKLLHKLNSNTTYLLGIYTLTTTDKKEYRVSFTLKDVSSKMNLIELRIEEAKVR